MPESGDKSGVQTGGRTGGPSGGPPVGRSSGPVACALEGCGVPVLRRAGGGRPRLYCSDAHRAEARRRRLGGTASADRTAAGEGGDLQGARALLAEAIACLERHEAAMPSSDALVAALRAEATGEILRAQQAAADAARQAASAQDLLARERGEWRDTLQQLLAERDEQAKLVEELTGALEGARAELEAELLRHHADAARAESLLEARRASHDTELAEAAAELAELRQHLVDARAAADHTGRQAGRAERALAERAAAAVGLEVRAARAEEQSRQAAERLGEAKAELDRLRRELAEERRHHRGVEAALRRQSRQPQAPRATGDRRRGAGAPAGGAASR